LTADSRKTTSTNDFSGALRQIAEPEEVIHSTGMVLILAAVAVLGAEGATLWDLNHRARAQFWST
ncbi:hypothetical protein ACJX0J_016390, partial [Zea mays]